MPQLRPFPNDIMDACFKAATDVCNEYSADERRIQEVLGRGEAAPQRGFLWEQLSDGAYDQFMMTKQRAGLL